MLKNSNHTKETRKKMSKSHIGKHHSEDTKKKIGKGNKGKQHSGKWKRNKSKIMKGNFNVRGKHWRIKDTSKMNKDKLGENNPNWKGGITSLIMRVRHLCQYCQWRSDVFTRDNFTCQFCGLRTHIGLGRRLRLEAHHIKEFAKIIEEYKIKTLEQALDCEELWNINNGITLCLQCHTQTKTK